MRYTKALAIGLISYRAKRCGRLSQHPHISKDHLVGMHCFDILNVSFSKDINCFVNSLLIAETYRSHQSPECIAASTNIQAGCRLGIGK